MTASHLQMVAVIGTFDDGTPVELIFGGDSAAGIAGVSAVAITGGSEPIREALATEMLRQFRADPSRPRMLIGTTTAAAADRVRAASGARSSDVHTDPDEFALAALDRSIAHAAPVSERVESWAEINAEKVTVPHLIVADIEVTRSQIAYYARIGPTFGIRLITTFAWGNEGTVHPDVDVQIAVGDEGRAELRFGSRFGVSPVPFTLRVTGE